MTALAIVLLVVCWYVGGFYYCVYHKFDKETRWYDALAIACFTLLTPIIVRVVLSIKTIIKMLT